MKKFVLIPILFLFIAPVFNQDSTSISLLFIGDIMGHDTQINAAFNAKLNTYQYDDCFDYIKDIIQESDITIANLEVTLAGPPHKGYPAFSSPDELVVAAKNAGIDCFVTANNHSCDRGDKGIIRTIKVLDSLNMPHTGTFKSEEDKLAKHPLIIEQNGFKIGLLNYTYGTNGLTFNEPAIVNLIDAKQIEKDLILIKSLSNDVNIVFFHWGSEYQREPNSTQIEFYELCKKYDIELIIGSHPHVLQKMEWNTTENQNDLVVYSLGNYVSNQRKIHTDGGAMAKVVLNKINGETKISHTGYYLTWVYTPLIGGKKKFYILPASKYEEYPSYFDNKESFEKMKVFLNNSRKLLYESNKNFPEFIYENKNGLWKKATN